MLSEVRGPVADPFLATVRDLVSGVCALWLGESSLAGEALRDAAVAARRTDNRLAHVYATACRALLAVENGDVASADVALRDAEAEVTDSVGDAHFVAMFPALARARLAAAVGDPVAARSAAESAVELARRGAGRVEFAAALVTAAAAARASGAVDADEDAAERLAEARSVLRRCQDPGPMLLAWFAAEQRAAQAARQQAGTVERLTERERAILALLPGPLSQREIAAALFVTPNTLKSHLRAVYRKLGAVSRNEAVVRARSLGLL